MYDHHDPRRFDETQPRPDLPYGRFASGNNVAGWLIALGIVLAKSCWPPLGLPQRDAGFMPRCA